jgi:hypothetical protein
VDPSPGAVGSSPHKQSETALMVYRFHTRVADMRGMPEVKTIGPDNKLLLTVRVT